MSRLIIPLPLPMAIEPAALSESTLTERYQTTIPEPIRKFLGLSKRDKIRYTIQSDGQVVISRLDREKDDPILGEFLNFLAKDIEKNPDRVQAIGTDLVDRVRSLTAQVELDLDSPLSDEDE